MYIAFFPEIGDQMAELSDLSIYQAMGIDMASFSGYVASVVVQYIPLILGIYAIITSTQTLGGEEDTGTLELILAMPLHRWQIVTMKAIALAIVSFLIVVIAGLGDAFMLNAISDAQGVNITPLELFMASLNAWPITMAFMMIGLFLGAYLPSRRTAALVLTLIFVSSYFGQILAGMAESVESLKALSLFNYFDTSAAIFTEGVEIGDIGVLLSIAAIFFVLALVSFQRRNVTVGAWPWQRAQIVEGGD
jgi:ABC-2 type transport system permease protein